MAGHIEPVKWHSRQRQIQRQPSMGETSMNILIYLYNTKRDGHPFAGLDGANKNSITYLTRLDLIFTSDGLDGLRYKITGRGERVMRAYLKPPKRSDGICPDCCRNPKKVYSTGRRAGYCTDCLRRTASRQCELGIDGRRTRLPGRVCSTCRKEPCHQFPGGTYSTYCRCCLKERRRKERRQRRATLLTRVRQGEFVKCQKRGCDHPVYVAGNTVFEVCKDHHRQYMLEYNDRRRPDSQAARARRYAHRLTTPEGL